MTTQPARHRSHRGSSPEAGGRSYACTRAGAIDRATRSCAAQCRLVTGVARLSPCRDRAPCRTGRTDRTRRPLRLQSFEPTCGRNEASRATPDASLRSHFIDRSATTKYSRLPLRIGTHHERHERRHAPPFSQGKFSEPNWKVGDTIALRDRIYRVHDVVYLDDGEVRGMLMLEEPPARPTQPSRQALPRLAKSQVGTGVGTVRAFAASLARMNRLRSGIVLGKRFDLGPPGFEPGRDGL